MTVAIFLIILLGFIALGMPIAFSLLLAAIGLMVHLELFDVQILAQNLLAGADNFALMAVPLFLLAGEIMNEGGMSKRMVALAVAMVGHVRGGVGYVAIIASVLLAALSGSAVADSAALAAMLVPMLKERGYSPKTSCGLVAAGGIIAPVIPPSISFIIFAVATNMSVTKLFMAGIVPGLLMGMTLLVVWFFVSRSNDHETPMPKASWAERSKALRESVWALMLPVIIIGGLKFGIFTPTEAAAVAATYALFVGLFVYKGIKFSNLMGLVTRAAMTTATVMFLVASALVTSYMITLADLPSDLIELLGPLVDSPILLMLVLVALLVVIGMAMDLTPTILILAPVLVPVIQKAGIDLTYFGVIFIMVGCTGLLTPPVGTVLNVVSGVAKIRMEDMVKGVLPYVIAYTILILLLVIFPGIITVPAKWFFS